MNFGLAGALFHTKANDTEIEHRVREGQDVFDKNNTIDIRIDEDEERNSNHGSDSSPGVLFTRDQMGRQRIIGEEAWNDNAEKQVREWAKEAKQAIKEHYINGKAHKLKHQIVGLPAIIIPSVMSVLTPSLSWYGPIVYINAAAFAVTATLALVHGFYKFDLRYQQHMDYSARYYDILSDIKYEMVRSREFRTPMDEFLTRLQMRLDTLAFYAPDT